MFRLATFFAKKSKIEIPFRELFCSLTRMHNLGRFDQRKIREYKEERRPTNIGPPKPIATLDDPEDWYRFLEMFKRFDKKKLPFVFISGKSYVGKKYLANALIKHFDYTPLDLNDLPPLLKTEDTVYSDPNNPQRSLLIFNIREHMRKCLNQQQHIVFFGNVKDAELREILFPASEVIRVCVVPQTMEIYRRAIWDVYLTNVTRNVHNTCKLLESYIKTGRVLLKDAVFEKVATQEIKNMPAWYEEYCKGFHVVYNSYKEFNEW